MSSVPGLNGLVEIAAGSVVNPTGSPPAARCTARAKALSSSVYSGTPSRGSVLP